MGDFGVLPPEVSGEEGGLLSMLRAGGGFILRSSAPLVSCEVLGEEVSEAAPNRDA